MIRQKKKIVHINTYKRLCSPLWDPVLYYTIRAKRVSNMYNRLCSPLWEPVLHWTIRAEQVKILKYIDRT